MHKTNSNTTLPNTQKENETTPAGRLLSALDAQMAASGMDADHPWRKQLAEVISTEIGVADEIDNITATTGTLDALLRLSLQECGEAGRDEKIGAAIRAARRYVGDINDYAAQMAGASA